jgi:hypothetical protein
MSAAASDAKAEAGGLGAPELESQTDRAETRLEYDPTSKVPIPVVMVWICALVGLGAYTVTWLLPDLQTWGAP